MDTIFFSYSRTDSAFVLKLAKDLRESGAQVWLDQLDIPAGSHWDASIQNALHTSKTLLIILTPTSVASENVMDEVSYALEEGKKVIPILHTECETPFRLRRLQRIDFTGDYKNGFDNLLQSIGLKEENKKAELENITEYERTRKHPVVEKSKPQPGKNINKFWFIGAGAVVLILILYFTVFRSSSGNSGEIDSTADSTSLNSSTLDSEVAPDIDTYSFYYLQNRANSNYLSVMDGSKIEDAPIVVVSGDGTALQECEKFYFDGSGPYAIISKNSNMILSIYQDNFIYQEKVPENGVFQLHNKFKFNKSSDGYYQIEVLEESGKVLALDPASDGKTDGQRVISMKNDYSSQTQWKLISTGEKMTN